MFSVQELLTFLCLLLIYIIDTQTFNLYHKLFTILYYINIVSNVMALTSINRVC